MYQQEGFSLCMKIVSLLTKNGGISYKNKKMQKF